MLRAAILAFSLVLASCGPKAIELPDDPIERAATCGAVAAASARVANPDVNSPLSLDAIGRVLHYPMLAGATGESFSSEAATRVQERMAEIQNRVGESKWQELVPACKAAFPATAVEEVALPTDRFEAQLGCDELGDFLRAALETNKGYGNELSEYRSLSYKLDSPLGSQMRSRFGADRDAQQDERRKALAAMAKAGPPVTVMAQCLERFG